MTDFDPFLGDPRHLPGLMSTRARGSLVNTRALYLRARHGVAALSALAEALGPEARALLSARQARDAWFPVAPMIEIDRAIFEGPMDGDLAEMRRFGREIATFELPIFQKVVLGLAGNPGVVLGRLEDVFAEYLSPLRAQIHGRESPAAIDLHEGLLPRYLCEEGCPGWVEGAMEVAGARRCEVRQVRCVHRGDASCAWRATWS